VDVGNTARDADVDADAAGGLADGADVATDVGDDLGARDGGADDLRRRARVSDWPIDAGEGAEDDGTSALGDAGIG
jgi:hypothetical protein